MSPRPRRYLGSGARAKAHHGAAEGECEGVYNGRTDAMDDENRDEFIIRDKPMGRVLFRGTYDQCIVYMTHNPISKTNRLYDVKHISEEEK